MWAIARGPVDERRALGTNSASYLLALEKDYKSSGVYINDGKGLFILRWYREVGADGQPLQTHRYQQPGCKAYELCLENDGVPFAWISTLQIISKVYLHKWTTKARTYSLPASDKKMLSQKVKAMTQH